MSLQYHVADAAHLPLADQSVDAVLGSPPYTDRRTYGIRAKRECQEWIRFMLECTGEALRVSRGPVLWVVNGCVKKGWYVPAVEGLIYTAHVNGYRLEHPLIWTKNAAPNRRDWWCNRWEFIVAFGHTDGRKYAFDWQAVATPQKFMHGGRFRQRQANGTRTLGKNYQRNPWARPYDVLAATVGGGQMGHPLAHENEAPYPEKLIEQIIPALVPLGGIILDPFAGSGTTGAVALRLGRRAVLGDIRESQIELARRRCAAPAPSLPPIISIEAALRC